MITSRQAGAPNELFTIHTDHLGTPMWVTDGLGAQRVWDPILEPFGNIHQEDTPAIQGTQESLESDLDTISNHTSTEAQQAIDISMPLRFAGQYFDTETQLHYNYFRDYDPSIGRYVQSDPIGLGGGVNTYGYVYQNPVGLIDPYGLAVAIPFPLIVPPPITNSRPEEQAGQYSALPMSSDIGAIDVICLVFPGLACLATDDNEFPSLVPDSIEYEVCDSDQPESCDEEWERAFQICGAEIGGENRGITGGYRDINSCARGLVSQRCGGNVLDE